MKFFRNTHGAVSVFLIIILVPSLLVASIFVDLGRVHMAKAMGESAADLALNSLLTNYDSDLKDWYGMVASCQNIDEFYKVSAEFFLRTISSQGMSEEEIFLLSDSFANVTGDDTIYDLLMIEPQTETTKIIEPVEGANLSNPTLIKDSIIEFMKYRAPIELTTNLIKRINEGNGDGDSGISQLLEADENEPLVKAKQEFYEAEGDLLAAAFKSYNAIMDYQKSAESMGLNNAKLVEYTNKLDAYKTVYKEIHTIAVKNLLNTSGLPQYAHATISLDKYSYDKTSSEIYSEHVIEEIETETDEGADETTESSEETEQFIASSEETETPKETVEHYYIDGDKIESLLSGLRNAITNFENACNGLASAGETLMNNLPGEGTNQAYVIQWWVQMNKAINTSHTTSVANAADSMVKAYAKVLAIDDCELRNNIPGDWSSRAATLTDKVSSYHSMYLDTTVTGTDAYSNTVKKLEEISSSNASKIKTTHYTVTVEGSAKSLDEALSAIATDLKDIRDDLQDRIEELNIAINGKGNLLTKKSERIESLDKLKELANAYETGFDSYNGKANTSTTDMGSKEQAEIEKDLATDKISDEINEAAVSDLKSRLVNIKNELQKMIDAIDSMKYGGTAVTSISSFSTFSNLAVGKGVHNNIPLNNGELDNHCSTTFSNIFVPNTEHVLVLEHTNDNAYNPDINPTDASVDCPELLKHFHAQWKDVELEQFTETEKDQEDTEEAQEKYAEEQKEAASAYRGAGTDPVKEFSEGTDYKAGVAIVSNVVSLFQNIVDGKFDHIRDDIYATTYVMEMFSYATYDREGQYSLVEDVKKLSLKDSSTPNKKEFELTYDGVLGTADQEKTWLSENVKDSYNKTLTNVMINGGESGNNASYLAEVEYILYGKSTNKENIKAAFGDIYALRYALNLVSCFQHFWNGNTLIEGVANGISMLFGYVIPVPVIKAVLLPILTAIETCRDNTRLSAGFPVEIYKTKKEDWWVWPQDENVNISGKYSEFFKALTEGDLFRNENTGKGFFYGDYIMLFVYTGFAGKNEKLEADMYRRTAEIIQQNINKKVKSDDENKYSLKNSIMYFRLDAQIRVKPLMITLPVFSEYNNGMKTSTDWCTFDIETVRGYS